IREISIGNIEQFNALTLAPDKVLHTNSNKALTQSDITAAAIALLNLSGAAAADRLPYLNGASGAALTPITPVARTLLDDTTTAGQRATLGLARPAFKATVLNDVSLSNGVNIVSFQNVNVNVGNGWNGTVFTAPEDGLYYFGCDFTITGGVENNGNTILSLFVRNNWWQETVRARRTDYFHGIELSTITRLAAGETFQPRLTLEGWAGTVKAAGGRGSCYGALIG
ncbi:hypothetical protein ACI0FS_03555, partial [Ochrobactrum quorumnocens]